MNVPACFGVARLGSVIIAITLQAFVQGCVAYRFSTPGLLSQNDRLPAPLLNNLVLGVETFYAAERSYNLEKFIDNLNDAGVFKAVGYLNRLPTADLVLGSFSYRETSPRQACLMGFEGQFLTVFTLGLLPQICNAKHEVSFHLYRSTNRQQEKFIAFTYETRSIVGWFALLYLPSADWSIQPLKEQYPNLLKAVFVGAAPDIERLVK